MSNIKTDIVIDNNDMHVVRTQDCNPYADLAKQMRDFSTQQGSDMKLAATLPYVLVEKYINDKGITFSEFVQNQEHAKRMLNDPANSAFRVWQGRV